MSFNSLRLYVALVCSFGALAVASRAEGAIIVLDAVAGGTSINLDSPNTTFLAVGGRTGFDLRAALEYDIAALPANAVINSATLSLTYGGGGIGAGGYRTMTYSIHGFAGDGTLSISDFAVSNAISGPYFDSYGERPGETVTSNPSPVNVTSFLQTLYASSSSFAGFTLRADSLPIPQLSHNFVLTSPVPTARPRLTIDYSVQGVPEPASLTLFGVGGLGLVVLRRRRQAV